MTKKFQNINELLTTIDNQQHEIAALLKSHYEKELEWYVANDIQIPTLVEFNEKFGKDFEKVVAKVLQTTHSGIARDGKTGHADILIDFADGSRWFLDCKLTEKISGLKTGKTSAETFNMIHLVCNAMQGYTEFFFGAFFVTPGECGNPSKGSNGRVAPRMIAQRTRWFSKAPPRARNPQLFSSDDGVKQLIDWEFNLLTLS